MLGTQLTLKWFSVNMDTQVRAAGLRADSLQLTVKL